MNALADLILGITKIVREEVGRTASEYAKLAEANPRGAAALLRLAAARLLGRSKAFRNQRGWRARRNRAVALELILEAERLEAGLPGNVCPPDQLVK